MSFKVTDAVSGKQNVTGLDRAASHVFETVRTVSTSPTSFPDVPWLMILAVQGSLNKRMTRTLRIFGRSTLWRRLAMLWHNILGRRGLKLPTTTRIVLVKGTDIPSQISLSTHLLAPNLTFQTHVLASPTDLARGTYKRCWHLRCCRTSQTRDQNQSFPTKR